MVHNCIVGGCKYRKRKNIVKGIVFHSFPVDPVRLKTWVDVVVAHSTKPINITRHSKICQFHFKETDYVSGSGDRRNTRHLKSTAIPSIFEVYDFSTEQGTPNSSFSGLPSMAKYGFYDSSGPAQNSDGESMSDDKFKSCEINETNGYNEYSLDTMNNTVDTNENELKFSSSTPTPTRTFDYANPAASNIETLESPFLIKTEASSDSGNENTRSCGVEEYDNCSPRAKKRKNLQDAISRLHKKQNNGNVTERNNTGGIKYDATMFESKESVQSATETYGSCTMKSQHNFPSSGSMVSSGGCINPSTTSCWYDFIYESKPPFDGKTKGEAELYHLLDSANLLSYYKAFIDAGGDDVSQLCDSNEAEFQEIVHFVGMETKPLHVKRFAKALENARNGLLRFGTYPSPTSTSIASQSMMNQPLISSNTPMDRNGQSKYPAYQTIDPALSRRIREEAKILSSTISDSMPMKPLSRKDRDEILAIIRMPRNASGRADRIRTYSAIYNRFDCKRREKPMNHHEICINEAAYHLCDYKPILLARRDKLFSQARKIVFNVSTKKHSGESLLSEVKYLQNGHELNDLCSPASPKNRSPNLNLWEERKIRLVEIREEMEKINKDQERLYAEAEKHSNNPEALGELNALHDKLNARHMDLTNEEIKIRKLIKKREIRINAKLKLASLREATATNEKAAVVKQKSESTSPLRPSRQPSCSPETFMEETPHENNYIDAHEGYDDEEGNHLVINCDDENYENRYDETIDNEVGNEDEEINDGSISSNSGSCDYSIAQAVTTGEQSDDEYEINTTETSHSNNQVDYEEENKLNRSSNVSLSSIVK